ncbi:MAG: cytochrome-c peroxidase [Ignavibacteria bacterium]|nr:cytochrome-c peroxidase [Ignavibacteria bacterium]
MYYSLYLEKIMKELLVLLVAILFMFVGCNKSKDSTPQKEDTHTLMTQAKQIFGALPDKMPGSENDTPELIELGKKLYFEKGLSINNSQSCNTCHNIEGKGAGVDNKPTSEGALGKKGTRNSPTVLNAGFHFVQFWDGRAKDLKEQAKGPILNPIEMGSKSEEDVVKMLSISDVYKPLFAKAFPKEESAITYDNMANAIAAFERTLVTKSRFDDFMNGNMAVLDKDELAGLNTFIKVGCITCHTGQMIGGNLYQKVGLYKPYKNITDLGRFEVTKQEADKFMFKVPTLRNIALTQPYFHDGAVATLEEAVPLMAQLNLNKELKPEEVKQIVAFLKSLSKKI